MIDIKVGEEKNNINEYNKFNEIKYIQEYIKFYYEKTNTQLKINRNLMIIMITLLIMNLLPQIIKILFYIKIT